MITQESKIRAVNFEPNGFTNYFGLFLPYR